MRPPRTVTHVSSSHSDSLLTVPDSRPRVRDELGNRTPDHRSRTLLRILDLASCIVSLNTALMPQRPFVRLYLVRHGEVDANREMRYLGRRDDPLNTNGRRQARRLAEAFTHLPVDAVRTSPLARARCTAEAIIDATGAAFQDDDRLLELDFGSWEGLTRKEVLGRDRDGLEIWERDPSLPTPAGDSLELVRDRVVHLADELLSVHAGGSVVLVSHVGPVKTLLNAALGLQFGTPSRIFLDPATISVVDWSAEPVVRLINSHAHLGWASPRWLDQRI